MLLVVTGCPRRGAAPRFEAPADADASSREADERGIANAMAGYVDALTARDPAAASGWVVSSTFGFYDQLRVLARAGTREQLEQRSLMEILMILELRNRYPGTQLDTLDGRALFDEAIRAGMNAEPIALDDLRFTADGQRAEVWTAGQPVVWFAREQGRWCVDLPAMIIGLAPLIEVDLADAIAAEGKLRVAFGLLEAQSVEGLDLELLDGPRAE